MIGKEALIILATLIQLMEEIFKEPISHVHGCVNGRIATTVVRFYYCMIHRGCLTSNLQDRDMDWDLVLGLGLAQ